MAQRTMMLMSKVVLYTLLYVVITTQAFVGHHSFPRRATSLQMVRNVDLPEALVFYGRHVFQDDDGNLLPGVANLIQECRDVETPVLLLLMQEEEVTLPEIDGVAVHSQWIHVPPPNPRALYEAIELFTEVQPRGFGGSSGFGRSQAVDPQRPPLFQHVVVLCDSIEACRAARAVGARVLCKSDNDLADAIVDEWDEFTLDDISTPGSYWLNPPHPKDDEGNRIDDVFELMEYYEQEENDDHDEDAGDDDASNSKVLAAPMEDDEMARILADLDPL